VKVLFATSPTSHRQRYPWLKCLGLLRSSYNFADTSRHRYRVHSEHTSRSTSPTLAATRFVKIRLTHNNSSHDELISRPSSLCRRCPSFRSMQSMSLPITLGQIRGYPASKRQSIMLEQLEIRLRSRACKRSFVMTTRLSRRSLTISTCFPMHARRIGHSVVKGSTLYA
jgi:hypothetical protein